MKVQKIALFAAIGFGVLLLVVGTLGFIIQFRVPKYPVESVSFSVISTPEKVANGKRIASMLCVHCHRSQTKNALTGGRLLDLDPAFGVAYASNITQHPDYGIANWSDADLARLIRTGVKPNGRATFIMPKFPLISDGDLESIIAYLRSDDPMLTPDSTQQPPQAPSFFAKFLATVAIKPYPYPAAPVAAPDTAQVASHGRYLSSLYGCFACHSASFATLNELEPEKSEGYFGGGTLLYDRDGNKVLSPNITLHPKTGIGAWTEEEFVIALKTAVTPSGYINQYPMQPYAGLTDAEAKAIYAYLKSVPMIDNAVSAALVANSSAH